MKHIIETCYSSALFDIFENKNAVVVVTDVFRATTSICTAFANGVKTIIPVKTEEEAKEYQKRGYLIAAERNGKKLDFADFGNSPENFKREIIEGKDIVYSTTNGTRTIQMGENCKAVAIGSFANFTVLVEWIRQQNSDVTLLCAGWKGKYNIEDSIFMGAIADALLQTGEYETICDSTIAAQDMWNNHKNDLRGFIEYCAQRTRLRNNGVDDCIDYCITLDTCKVVPVYKDGKITDALK
ncbi:MAG: 2-phosphosulfolactate phosphatase [Bacteroidales bacterium]|nr:2-phosphosulfolactate phosphatase [Bacteroidales bacterium]